MFDSLPIDVYRGQNKWPLILGEGFMTTGEIIGTVISLLYAAFCLWMLVDCIANEEDKSERVTWGIFIALIGFLFAPLYYFQRYRPRKKSQRDDKPA
jgi:hypothetical protein